MGLLFRTDSFNFDRIRNDLYGPQIGLCKTLAKQSRRANAKIGLLNCFPVKKRHRRLHPQMVVGVIQYELSTALPKPTDLL